MPPQTRAQKRKGEAPEVQGGEQDGQRRSQPQSQEMKRPAKPRAKAQAKQRAKAVIRRAGRKGTQPAGQTRSQQLNSRQGQQKTRQPKQRGNGQGGQADNHQSPQADPTPTHRPRERRNGTWPPRIRSKILRDPKFLQRFRSGIRKAPQVQWQGTLLPRFDIPYWKVRAGVPTIVLRTLPLGTGADTAGNSEDVVEEIEIDSQSEYSEQRDGEGDAPTQDPAPLPPLPSPPSLSRPTPAAPGDRVDIPILVDSQARAPRWREFYPYYKDEPGHDVKPLTFPNVGFASEEEITKWGARMARFIRSPYDDSDDAAGWYGLKPLGKGGFGMAGVWEKRDINGQVIDQVVIKQIGKDSRHRWYPQKPDEVECMEGLNVFTTAGDSTVRFRRYKRYPRREVHRIYMEYCPYGDLNKLIKEYRARRQFIPEKFIWDVFYHLARACKGLEEIPPDHDKTPDNTETVHRDIKPANVFLGNPGTPTNGCNPIYPTAKLGDFGIVIFTGTEDQENPFNYRGVGTPGYMPLEQEYLTTTDPSLLNQIHNHPQALFRLNHYRKHESHHGRLPQLLSHTNIWGVGAVIFELLSLKQAMYYLYDYIDGEEEGETYLEAITDDALADIDIVGRYTGELIGLMRECLRPNPAKRPTPGELLERVQRVRGEGDGMVVVEEKERIPFGDFESLEMGEWEPDPNQAYPPPPGSRFSRSSLRPKVEEVRGEVQQQQQQPPPQDEIEEGEAGEDE
ncbi:MAG: hypothetical protein Q9225_007232 [Loekoesia sp. 1 TL-2023]